MHNVCVFYYASREYCIVELEEDVVSNRYYKLKEINRISSPLMHLTFVLEVRNISTE